MIRYQKLDKLGEGAYGIVFKARDLNTNGLVAVKKIILDQYKIEGIPPTTLREISLLRELEHPNIVILKDVVQEQGDIHLIFEFAENDLKKHLDSYQRDGGLPRELIKSYMNQLLNGISFCHTHRVVHRDLKPQNLLLGRRGDLKIADFGLARTFSVPLQSYTHDVITLWYRAPEILLGSRHYSTPVDVWSAGCIFAELAAGAPPFPGDSEIDQLFRIFRAFGTPGVPERWPAAAALPDFRPEFPRWFPAQLSATFPGLPPDGLDLLARFLTYDPTDRISARAAMSNRYFEGVGCNRSGLKTTAVNQGTSALQDEHPKKGATNVSLMSAKSEVSKTQAEVMDVDSCPGEVVHKAMGSKRDSTATIGDAAAARVALRRNGRRQHLRDEG